MARWYRRTVHSSWLIAWAAGGVVAGATVSGWAGTEPKHQPLQVSTGGEYNPATMPGRPKPQPGYKSLPERRRRAGNGP